MSVSILEALMNAEHNFKSMLRGGDPIIEMAQRQLHNGITLLEKGYDVDEEVEPLLEKYGDVESVPDKDIA